MNIKHFVSLIVLLVILVEGSQSNGHPQGLNDLANSSSNDQSNYELSQSIQNSQYSYIHHLFNKTISQSPQFLSNIFQSACQTFSHIYQILNNTEKTSRPVHYKDNFASVTGGAQILMISSDQIMSTKSILDGNPDVYLYTEESLPITIIIGLNQQVMLHTFVLKSSQVYSRITKDFILEGSFSISQQTQWIFLGNLTAENTFQKQYFNMEHTIIKYLKLTIVSSYGAWKYFSLTQIQVFGQGLFTHALQTLVQANIKERQQLKKQILRKQSTQNLTSQMISQELQNLVDESMDEFQTQAHSLVYNLINHKIPFAIPKEAILQQANQKQKNRQIKRKQHIVTIQMIQIQEEVDDLQHKLMDLEKNNLKLKHQINQLKEEYLKSLEYSRSTNPYESAQIYLIVFSFLTSFICVFVLLMIQYTRKKQAEAIQSKKKEMFKEIALEKVALIVKSSSLFKQFAEQ